MRVPLDVAYLNSEGRVIDIAVIRPGRVHRRRRGARTVVESDLGTLARWQIKLGSVITLSHDPAERGRLRDEPGRGEAGSGTGLGRWARIAGTAALVAGLVAGCTGTASGPGRAGTPSGTRSPSTPPAMVQVDGFERLSSLPAPLAAVDLSYPSPSGTQRARAEVLSVSRAEEVVRVVLAWDRPASGDPASPRRFMADVRRGGFGVGWELYDPAAGTIAEPLRTSDGCLCSENIGALVTDQALYWADFPAPSGATATLLLGSAMLPLAGLSVTGEPAALPVGDLVDWSGSQPPATPGAGAQPAQVRTVRRLSETAGGQTDSSTGSRREVGLPSDVLFALDSYRLSASGVATVDRLVSLLLVAAHGQRVRVVGHTDDQGAAAYNLALSRRRAQTVAAALSPRLAAAGITLEVVGRGETQPLLPNRTAAGKPIVANQARNRRVAVEFTAGTAGDAGAAAGPTTLPAATAPAARPAEGTPPAGSLASAGLAVRDGTIRADVMRAERIAGQAVLVEIRFASTGSAPAEWGGNVGVLGPNPYHDATNETMANVVIRDPKTGTGYHPLDEGDGFCLGTREIGDGSVYPDPPFTLWAYYPAPPASVGSIDLELGRFGLVRGVVLS